MSSFAQLLREARKRTGASQKELADQVGVDHSYISKIERGVYGPPTRDKVLAIADALEITGDASRAYFLLAAGCANVDDLVGLKNGKDRRTSEDLPLPFGDGAFHYPRTEQLEEEVIVERVRHLLTKSGLTSEKRSELYGLLRSFLTWLEFWMRDDSEG